MPVTTEQVERFMTLFAGNERSFGVWSPRTKKMRTEIRPVSAKEFADHLNGKMGVGIVPINDENDSLWGAVDIDNHGDDHDLPIDEVANILKERSIPAIACRSKSGGIHVYYFSPEPVAADKIRKRLVSIAQAVGYPKAEIFPKQSKLLSENDGSRQLGNWINLPYFGGDDTDRYAVKSTGAEPDKLSLEDFLEAAESAVGLAGDRADAPTGAHPDAPPCIQTLLRTGVPSGYRNEGLYNTVVYLRKAFPDDYRDRAFDAAGTMCNPPLPMVEARRTINSASRRAYTYKCDEEPIKSVCNRPVCLQRKFGVGQDNTKDPNGSNHGALPVFSDLVKYTTDPIKWSIKMDGVVVDNLSTEEIMRYSKMEVIIVERLGRGAPMLKEKDWRAIINGLLDEHRIEEVPDDASSSGVIRAKLVDFMKKAALTMGDDFSEDRSVVLRGLPIMYRSDGRDYIAFRGQDFQKYLKDTRTEELKGVNIFFAIKTMGVENHNVRVGDAVIKMWCIPMNDEWRPLIKPVSFHSDI